jgi:hypothetical protein
MSVGVCTGFSGDIRGLAANPANAWIYERRSKKSGVAGGRRAD